MPFEIDDYGAVDVFTAEVNAMADAGDNERIFGEVASARLFGFQPLEAQPV